MLAYSAAVEVHSFRVQLWSTVRLGMASVTAGEFVIACGVVQSSLARPPLRQALGPPFILEASVVR